MTNHSNRRKYDEHTYDALGCAEYGDNGRKIPRYLGGIAEFGCVKTGYVAA